MATTTNYAWTTPDNSGLVKNGAQDIRTLGSSVDTALWNSGYGQAGKNKIINGDFTINQRSFSTTSTSEVYGFDRWFAILTDGTTNSYSAQTFIPGAAPIVGYEATNFVRLISAGQTLSTAQTSLRQRIESVRTFADQTITVSFWAKAATGTPKVALEVSQSFGSGGSSNVDVYGGQITLSTSWARYSLTVAIPSISGKTIATGNYLSLSLFVSAGTNFNARTGSLGIQSNTFDVWGVQVEYGSVATPFQTATGTIQGELSACQRYYYRVTAGANDQYLGSVVPFSSTGATGYAMLPVIMRATTTILEYSGLQLTKPGTGSAAVTSISVAYYPNSTNVIVVPSVASGLTGGEFRFFSLTTSGTSYFGISAEL
jgi:hypothetical protein